MAVTQLAILSNRRASTVLLSATSSAVPVDASVQEFFTLPTGFGDFICEAVEAAVTGLSGTYVATVPPFDGIAVGVLQDNARVDFIGAQRWVNQSTATARPNFEIILDLQNHVLVRQTERVDVNCPIIGGAGVTAAVTLRLRGLRVKNN